MYPDNNHKLVIMSIYMSTQRVDALLSIHVEFWWKPSHCKLMRLVYKLYSNNKKRTPRSMAHDG